MDPAMKDSPLKLLRQVVVPVPEPELAARQRERVTQRVQQLQLQLGQLQLGRRQRRRRAFALALAAGVLSVALGFGLLWRHDAPELSMGPEAHLLSGQIRLKTESATAGAPLSRALDLSSQPVLVTAEFEHARLALPSQALLDIGPSSEVGLTHTSPGKHFRERVRLKTGRVALEVPKLAPGQGLSVETDTTLVEVKGTKFAVSVLDSMEAKGRTRVDVEEGRVIVTAAGKTTTLVAGQSWTSGGSVVTAHTSAPPLADDAELVPALRKLPISRSSAARDSSPKPGSAASESDLGEQNRLFQGAQVAKRSGLPGLALDRLETLIERYPRSELAHNARVEHFRLLRESARNTEARRSAQAYLRDYPKGFARDEARALVHGN